MRKRAICGFLVMIMVFSVLFISACKKKEAQVVPEECSNSFIYRRLSNPMIVDTALQIVTLEAVKKNVITLERAKNLLDLLEAAIQQEEITYMQFFMAIRDQLDIMKKYTDVAVIITNTLDAVYEPIKIDACDKELLRKFVMHQRNVLSAL